MGGTCLGTVQYYLEDAGMYGTVQGQNRRKKKRVKGRKARVGIPPCRYSWLGLVVLSWEGGSILPPCEHGCSVQGKGGS